MAEGLGEEGRRGGAGGRLGTALRGQFGGMTHGGVIQIHELQELRIGHITTHGGQSSSRATDSGLGRTYIAANIPQAAPRTKGETQRR